MASDPLKPASYGVVAGILDRLGGRRYTATDDGLHAVADQLVEGEQAYIVPDHREPFVDDRGDGIARPALGRTHAIVTLCDAVIDQAFASSPCGTCRACCITLFIADTGDGFTKSSHTPCASLCATGCGVYDKRPATCRAFRCVWLKSQSGNRPLEPELRPDRCGAILTDHELCKPIAIHVAPGKNKSWALQRFIEQREAEGERFMQVTRYIGEVR